MELPRDAGVALLGDCDGHHILGKESKWERQNEEEQDGLFHG